MRSTQLFHGMIVLALLIAPPIFLNQHAEDRYRHSMQGLYAMAVMGTELLDEFFQRQPETLGAALLAAKRRMVAEQKPEDKSLNRRLLDGLARGAEVRRLRGGAGRQRSRCPLAALCLPLEDASHAGVPSPGSERSNRGSALARLSAAGDVLPGGARRAPAPRCTAYLTGNHIIAERMYRRDLAVMPRAQPGTVIYAGNGGPAEGSSPAGRAPPLQLDRPGERRRARP